MTAICTLPPVVLQTIFGTRALRLGRTTRFIRRQGKLHAEDFARTFCLFLIRGPKASLARLASELSITTLEIADLGFFDTDRFRTHNRRGVWWWTRLPARISVCSVGSDEWVELAAE